MIKLFITLLVISTTTFSYGDEFCEGFKDGYVAGYCDVKGKSFCTKPIVPICPIKNIGEKGYRDGYNRGFKSGMRKASQPNAFGGF